MPSTHAVTAWPRGDSSIWVSTSSAAAAAGRRLGIAQVVLEIEFVERNRDSERVHCGEDEKEFQPLPARCLRQGACEPAAIERDDGHSSIDSIRTRVASPRQSSSL